MKLRALVLQIIVILCDLRANYRISCAVHTYECVFEEMQQKQSTLGRSSYRQESQASFHSSSSTSQWDDAIKETFLQNMFRPHEGLLGELSHNCFFSSIVCPDHIGADRVMESYEGNIMVECLLGLSEYGDRMLTENAISLIFRQTSQYVRFCHDLSQVSILVYSDSIDVFNATNEAIRSFSGIQKRLNTDERDAYSVASELLMKMQGFLQISDTQSNASVTMNQKIMMDLHFEVVLVNILRLPLKRLSSNNEESNGFEVMPDVAVNIPRRILFQDTFGEFSLI